MTKQEKELFHSDARFLASGIEIGSLIMVLILGAFIVGGLYYVA